MPSPERRCDSSESVDQRIAEIRALVEAEDFSAVERMVQGLPALVESLALADRKSALKRVQGFLGDLHRQALSKSEQLSSELSAVRNGRVATAVYRQSGRLARSE